jgi:hypothetical protein
MDFQPKKSHHRFFSHHNGGRFSGWATIGNAQCVACFFVFFVKQEAYEMSYAPYKRKINKYGLDAHV